MLTKRERIAYGLLIAPLIPFIFYNIPLVWELYYNPESRNSAPLFWFTFNAITAYGQFLIYACICHVILSIGKLSKAWHYCLVMFVVVFFLSMAVHTISFSYYDDYQRGVTAIIRAGSFMSEGFLLLIRESLLNSVLYSVSFYVFWRISKPEVSADSL